MTETVTLSTTLTDLAERFWAFLCHESPVTAIQAGVVTKDAVVFREGPSDFDRRYIAAGTFLGELRGIPEHALDVQDRATHRLLRRELDDIRSFNDVRLHQRPSLFPFGPEFSTTSFANTTTVVGTETAELYVERIAGIPKYFLDLRANLHLGYLAGFRYPRRVLAAAAASVRACTQGNVEALAWFSPFRRSAVSTVALRCHAEAARRIVSSEVLPALLDYAEFLEGPLAIDARESLSCTDGPDGEKLYATLIRHFTTTDLTALELHDLGCAEVERLSSAMHGIAANADFRGNLAGYRAHLAADPVFIAKSKEALREQMEVVAKRIDLKLPAFFGRTPRATYGVQSMSEQASAALPAAYAQPNPADRSGPGVLWITGLPEKAPSFLHVPLALHEGWPGHLMHLALVQEREDLPAFRRFGALRYSVCLEGWALYCEGLGVEMGLYATVHQEYGRLEMEMWRALRLVADTGLHAMGWSRAKAVEYMAAHQVIGRSTIEAEVDRYVGYPAQALAYHVGLLKFRDLRRRVEAHLGSAFDVRAYHDRIMAAGPVTLPVLEDIVEGAFMQHPLHH